MATYLLSDGEENIVTYPYNIGMLRRDNPNTSFPASPSDAILAEWDVFEVVSSTRPTIDVLTQSIVEGTPTTADGGVTWTQVWDVVELDAAAQVTTLAELEATAQRQSESLLDAADQFVVQALVQGKALTPEFEAYRNSVLNYQSLPGYPEAPVFPTLPEVFETDPVAIAAGALRVGNVNSDLNWTQDYWIGENTAPLTFFKNEDIGNNSVDYSYKDIMAHTSFGLASFSSQVTGGAGTYLRADRIQGFGEWYLSGLLATNGTWCGYSGSFNHAYSWASYDVNRRQTIERIKVANYATDYTIGIVCADPTKINGHWKTKYYIRNEHASQNVSVVGQDITITTKAGVTVPTIAPGEEWIVELEVFRGLDNTPRYMFVDAYQVV